MQFTSFVNKKLQDDGEQEQVVSAHLSGLRNIHTEIMSNIGHIQGKTSQILKDQERDLMRAFSSRLDSMHRALDVEKSKNANGSIEWIQKCQKLTEELDWIKDMAYRIEDENKQLLNDNKRLKAHAKTQEEDRQFLIKQLLSVKKENARLKQLLHQISDQSKQHDTPPMPALHDFHSEFGSPQSSLPEAPLRIRSRDDQTSSLVRPSSARSDVQKEIAQREAQRFNRTNSKRRSAGRKKKSVGVEDLNAADRAHVLELLFAQERVLSLLYYQAFPIRSKQQPASKMVSTSELPPVTNQRLERGELSSSASSEDGIDRRDLQVSQLASGVQQYQSQVPRSQSRLASR